MFSPDYPVDGSQSRKRAALHCAAVVAVYSLSMTPTHLLVPTYRNMLQTLAGLLDKAQQQRPDQAEGLLSARLSADMFPLTAQIRFAVFQAQEAVFRLRGEPIPEWLHTIAAEGRNAGDAPGSIANAKEHIEGALSFLADVSDHALDAGAGSSITIQLPDGITFDMTGEQYIRDWALPQFYFHVIAAYAIIRTQGVEIGKADYVPHMFAYLRSGTMPVA